MNTMRKKILSIALLTGAVIGRGLLEGFLFSVFGSRKSIGVDMVSTDFFEPTESRRLGCLKSADTH